MQNVQIYGARVDFCDAGTRWTRALTCEEMIKVAIPRTQDNFMQLLSYLRCIAFLKPPRAAYPQVYQSQLFSYAKFYLLKTDDMFKSFPIFTLSNNWWRNLLLLALTAS